MASDESLNEFAQAVQELASRRMTFGKYGPRQYPPAGLLLCDLPFEYLSWMKRKGFPPGRLGQLLALLYQLKLDGAEEIFRPFRKGIPESRPRKTLRKIDFE